MNLNHMQNERTKVNDLNSALGEVLSKQNFYRNEISATKAQILKLMTTIDDGILAQISLHSSYLSLLTNILMLYTFS